MSIEKRWDNSNSQSKFASISHRDLKIHCKGQSKSGKFLARHRDSNLE